MDELEVGREYKLKNGGTYLVEAIHSSLKDRVRGRLFNPDGKLISSGVYYTKKGGLYITKEDVPGFEFHVDFQASDYDEPTRDRDGWKMSHFRKAIANTKMYG